MASAIITGLLKNKHYLPKEIACTCGDDNSGPELAAKTGIQFLHEITEATCEADVVVLACKPQQFNSIETSLSEAASNKLILSILAGTPLARLNEKFNNARNIVRTMPNTPGQIGMGVTAYAPQNPPTPKDQKKIEEILNSLGDFHQVEESQIDAITALSGSGPAYLFEFAAALREAGIAVGLQPELAKALTIQTLLGSTHLLAQSEATPEELRNAVTSPGGTTAAALKIFNDYNLRAVVQQAIMAARDRSIELASE